eukprot:3614953-Amphidinium_carterae.2
MQMHGKPHCPSHQIALMAASLQSASPGVGNANTIRYFRHLLIKPMPVKQTESNVDSNMRFCSCAPHPSLLLAQA